MNPDTLEIAIPPLGAQGVAEASAAAAAAAPAPTAPVRPTGAAQAPGPAPARPAPVGAAALERLRAPLDRVRADPRRREAVRDSWQALWSSRLLVWATGVGTVLAFGFGPARKAFNPPGVTRGFSWLGDLLAAPAARWDSAWYLVIAHYGYRPDLGRFTAARTAFFPLYPLGVRAVSWLGSPPVLAGVLLSLCALALALYGIHRLAALELGSREAARLAVLATAFAPMAFFLSAVYSESLYLALSVGVFWSAREGRWALVGTLGGLAAATRSTGLVLLVPALAIYLYGPRRDRAPDRAGSGQVTQRGRLLATRGRQLAPRYRLRPDVMWLALIPAAVGLFALWLGLSGGDALAPFRSQQIWERHFAGPYVAVWDGLRAAFEGARQLLSGQTAHVYFPAAPGSPTVAASHNLMLLGFLLAAVPAVVLVLRRLPLAYGLYVLAALALPLSYPVAGQPLMSLPRFLLVLFPLPLAVGAWLAEHPRARAPLIGASAVLMVAFGAQFATWHWVA